MCYNAGMSKQPICPQCGQPYTGEMWLTHSHEPVFVHRQLRDDGGHTVLLEGCVASAAYWQGREEVLAEIRRLYPSEPA